MLTYHYMDDKWFKQRQKIAGVTAEDIAAALGRDRSVVSRIYVGRQNMTLDQAKVFARVLNVELQEVLKRAGMATTAEARKVMPGFSEGDAAPYDVQKAPARIRQLSRDLGSGAPGVDIWRVNSTAMMFMGYVPGDFMLIDTNLADRAKAGNLVIAQVYDWNTGTATTLLRRYQPPVLVADGPNPDNREVHVVDGRNVVIRGVCTASWRSI